LSIARAYKCGRGGIGRRAALRSLFFNRSGSSSLLDRTKSEFLVKTLIKRLNNKINAGFWFNFFNFKKLGFEKKNRHHKLV
jgi:hypothetical protein